MSELKPCPFCGSVDVTLIEPAPDAAPGHMHGYCWQCYAAGPYKDGLGEIAAIAAWNTRQRSTPA